MKRIWGIVLIVILLVCICFTEELLVGNTLKKIKKESDYLYNISVNLENVNTDEIITKTDNLYKFWKKREMVLCFFINYKDMSEMSNEIVKMVSYAKNNIKEEYTTSLLLLKYYCETFNHITGINIQNIF